MATDLPIIVTVDGEKFGVPAEYLRYITDDGVGPLMQMWLRIPWSDGDGVTWLAGSRIARIEVPSK